ncbi:protein OXIDATIVE STRESS 3-like [Lycium ferocissimum]|uniref:protein OXIDATIVE STRESS 3-like n=1 Tax=Lycium ferocissimum TaxID=112874 RepID=UPI002815B758|nr:protein OXIDATIVE STRESS 3-like [Lycium ferocissimum]
MDEENQDSLSDFSEEGVFSNFSSSEDESSDPTSPNSSSGSSSNEHKIGALQNMSSLLQELPFKRGLSKHYNGKSQSFTSLSNVRSLEDMAKPENPYNKKLKSCKSYGVFLEGFKSDHLQSHVIRSSSSSRLSSKRGSCSSPRARRNGSFLGNNSSRPPVPPHRSTSTASFTSQTPLFA